MKRSINILHLCAVILFTSLAETLYSQSELSLWASDNRDGTYNNPIIFADYSDPDVIRVEDDFYLVSSSFSNFPGLPILHSNDLVNWEIIGHVVNDYPFEEFHVPQHGKGIWAPSLRFHDGEYYVYFGDPDHGILMSKTKDPSGRWEPLHLVKKAKGWIDPCPFWDDEGNAYLVHAWAKSRVGFNSILTINKMSRDGKSILDEGTNVFDGHDSHPTIEGPKLYKRNDYYYIFAPAGGVKPGWQTVLRSKNIYGPYEDKVVLEQGSTNINGPHQGGLVELESGESWFIHFQDRYAYGRVVHLNPVRWKDDWPEMGIDLDGNGIGEPVLTFNKPNVSNNKSDLKTSRMNDEFNMNQLGLQWQWESVPNKGWYSLDANKGNLRLFSQPVDPDSINLRNVSRIAAQKFPAMEFTFTSKFKVDSSFMSVRSGIIILGQDYCALEINSGEKGLELRQVVRADKDKLNSENIVYSIPLHNETVYLKAYIREGAVCSFAYSIDGKKYAVVGKEFKAAAGRWIGAKLGLFSINYSGSEIRTYADFDWVILE